MPTSEAQFSDTDLLQDISGQLIREQNVAGLYEKLIDAAVVIMHSDYASMQMLYPERGKNGELRLLAFRGFNAQAAKFWEWVRVDSGCTCGAALGRGERVIVPDVEACDFMAGTDDLATYLDTGIRAVQSTPLLSRGGKVVGMISTHWRTPYQPPEHNLHLLDIVARQAADLIERVQTEEVLRASEERLRALTDTLEAQVRIRTAELEQRNREALKQSERLRELSQSLMQIQDEERRRIARELHDSSGQSLAALGLYFANIARKAPQVGEIAKQGQELVQQITQEIRTTSYLLHPPSLDESGLGHALVWYVDGLQQRSGIDLTLSIPEDFGRLSRELELAVFRIVQECLTNIHRHSGSKVAAIRLTRDRQFVSLEVEDRGSGIAAEALLDIESQGVGIRGIHERALQFGGELKIESGQGGTKIRVAFPFATRELKSTIAVPSQM